MRPMREIRLALLEADVNFKVVKSFTATLEDLRPYDPTDFANALLASQD